MRVYTLPELRPIERALQKAISGSSRSYADWKIFPAGESYVRVRDVFGRACVLGRVEPPGDNLVKTLMLLDTLRREGARELTLVAPYLAYGRQDRQTEPGGAVSAAAVLSVLAAAGARKIITVDSHSEALRDLCPVPLEDASVLLEMARYFASEARRGIAVVSPDRGGLNRAAAFASVMGGDKNVVWMEKRRLSGSSVRVARVHGKLDARAAVIVDDVLDTGATVAEAAAVLRAKGVEKLWLCVAHPVFSSGAAARIVRSRFERIFVSDTLEAPSSASKLLKFRVISASGALSRAVLR